MFKKKVLKRIVLGFMALIMILTSIAPVFAEESDISRFEKTQYENKYGKNGTIPTTEITGYEESYKLSNEYMLESNVVMYLFTEDLYYLDSSEFVYQFSGTMDATNEYCDMGFSFDLGLLSNKKATDSREINEGYGINLREYQFSIYPGFYNFYYGGMNGFWSSINDETAVLKTLTPNFNLSQDDGYLLGKDAWVEVRESSETTRIYVMLGTTEWYNAATKTVADWAMEIERSIYQSSIQLPEMGEEVEVEVDDEKLQEALKDKEVPVEEETNEEINTFPSFTEAAPQEQVEPTKDYSYLIKYCILAIIAIVVGIIGYNIYKKITIRKY